MNVLRLCKDCRLLLDNTGRFFNSLLTARSMINAQAPEYCHLNTSKAYSMSLVAVRKLLSPEGILLSKGFFVQVEPRNRLERAGMERFIAELGRIAIAVAKTGQKLRSTILF